MRKLAVLMMMPALVFMVVAMASAEDNHPGGIHGDYAMSAVGSCLHSYKGFTGAIPGFTGIPDDVWGGSNMAQAIWTFERNGTGKVEGTNYPTFPPPAPINPLPPTQGVGVGKGTFSFDFTYHVTHDGAITVWVGPLKGTNLVNGVTFETDCVDAPCLLHGMVSSDHKTMTLASENEYRTYTLFRPDGSQLPFTLYAICNYGRVLIRVSDRPDE